MTPGPSPAGRHGLRRPTICFMATDQKISELLAAAEDALAEAGFRTGDFGRVRAILAQAQAEATRTAEPDGQARAIELLGMVHHYENITRLMSGSEVTAADIDAEERLFRQALAHWQQSAEPAAAAQALFGLGLVFQVLHSDWMTAMPYFWQALGLVSAPDADVGRYLQSEVHRHVGFYFLVADVQPTEAVRHLRLSLDLREQLGDERRIPSGLVALAQALLAAGDPDQAVVLLRQAVELARAASLLAQRIEDAEQVLREAEAMSRADPAP